MKTTTATPIVALTESQVNDYAQKVDLLVKKLVNNHKNTGLRREALALCVVPALTNNERFEAARSLLADAIFNPDIVPARYA